MAIPRHADGEPVEQPATVDRNPEQEESVDARVGSLREDMGQRIDAENFEGIRVGDSRVCEGRRGEAAWVNSRRR
jgi:hypothetical protein